MSCSVLHRVLPAYSEYNGFRCCSHASVCIMPCMQSLHTKVLRQPKPRCACTKTDTGHFKNSILMARSRFTLPVRSPLPSFFGDGKKAAMLSSLLLHTLDCKNSFFLGRGYSGKGSQGLFILSSLSREKPAGSRIGRARSLRHLSTLLEKRIGSVSRHAV